MTFAAVLAELRRLAQLWREEQYRWESESDEASQARAYRCKVKAGNLEDTIVHLIGLEKEQRKKP